MKKLILSASLFSMLFFTSCGGGETKTEEVTDNTGTIENSTVEEEEEVTETTGPSKGIGPITSIELGDIDDALAEEGKEIFKANCTACHKIGKRSVGPALGGITNRREPEWIMNMILNPEEMVEKDPIAKELLAEYLAPMANQSLSEDEARAILEFLRTKEE